MSNINEWDRRFICLARHISYWSKDPSTKVGAVIVRPNRTIASVGYNGFPRFVDDNPKIYADRPRKLLRTVHAEVNAILSANGPVVGCTAYVTPLHPCANCAGILIQSGIMRIVAEMPTGNAAWAEHFAEAAAMFREARICVYIMTE